MEYGYLVVEGHHDIEYIGALLKKNGLSRIVRIDTLDQYWQQTNIIPRKYPPDGDLMKRVPSPVFFQNDKYSLAVHSAIGDANIVRTIRGTLLNVETLLIDATGIGIIIDADYRKGGGIGRFSEIKSQIKDLIPVGNNPGQILSGRPNSGIFVLPDNNVDGTLETILIKCAQKVYSNLCTGAESYVNGVDSDKLVGDDKKYFITPSGKNKAIVGCVGNILRPGKAIQVSIQDNRWICDETVKIPEIEMLNQFLKELFNLTS